MKPGNPVQFAVVGFGYWGPHLVRNISLTEGGIVSYVCDLDESRLRETARRFPGVTTTQRLEDILDDAAVDIVAIATPVHSHYGLAIKALQARKHVLIEKPLAASSEEAVDILATANRWGRKVFVDHTFVFTPAVRKLRELLVRNELGRPLYYDSIRINLGIFQHDVNVVWDLVTHDIAILDFLLEGRMPVSASCTGAAHFGAKHADLAYLTLTYDDDFIAHINVNWLAPVKVRQVLLCGDRRMVVYDDNSASEKLKVYDSGVDVKHAQDLYEMLVQYRVGDMHAPRLETAEALSYEIRNIVETLQNKTVAVADGEAGLRVVSVLEAADESLSRSGVCVPIVPVDSAASLDGKLDQRHAKPALT
ncbi:MAG: Gfo/Idh/MocA family oxidoreductase [Candidatus Eremiobacteraeota bacterium]|nr:Gfo/Idh/MocA family oxidoreductase [Candidatus Eremiobacteraeota bacterium]